MRLESCERPRSERLGKELMSEAAVHEILHRIEELSGEDRLLLQQRLAELADAEWRREAEQARQIAKEKGLDQSAIDQAIHSLRYPS